MAEKKESLKKMHKVSFKRNPSWIRLSNIGKYQNIRFRLEYKKYYSVDAEQLIEDIRIAWPGRIPDDKAYAEKGIKELFKKRIKDKTYDYEVIDDTDLDAKLEQMAQEELLQELLSKETDDNIIKKLDEIPDS